MRSTNRIHGITRWPKDPYKRILVAQTDIDYVSMLSKLGLLEDCSQCDAFDIKKVLSIAYGEIKAARQEIESWKKE